MPLAPLSPASHERVLAGLLILLGGFAAYHNSFELPFLFDDIPAIVDNPSLCHFWTAANPLAQPSTGVYGRPLISLSLALNYALGGTNVVGYHIANLAIHLSAAFLLFGIVRRTLLLPVFTTRCETTATRLGGIVALLWVTHPLLTESVSSVIQRTESLMAVFYLLTLYAFIRSVEPGNTRLWQAICGVTCVLGMLCKEVMVSAPMVVLLFDRTFVAGGFREAWLKRKAFHLALASTWLVLIALVIATKGDRGGTCGLGDSATPWTYALTQCAALTRYIGLAFWPSPLVFDYGMALITRPADVLFRGLFVLSLLFGTGVALWRAPRIGFVAAFFFLVLAPSSSILPLVTQTMAEHRMYLPLAAVIILFVFTLHRLIGNRIYTPCLALACVLTLVTALRNLDYASGETLWRDTIEKCPTNARAHNNLGSIYFTSGREREALDEFETAIRLDPYLSNAHYNRGMALLGAGLRDEAKPCFAAELHLHPNHTQARFELGRLCVESGDHEKALPLLQATIQAEPTNATALCYLGDALAALGQNQAAQSHYKEAIALRPDYAPAHCSLADLLAGAGEPTEAAQQFQEALRLQPDYADAHNNYANLLVQLGQFDQALEHYAQAVKANPALVDAHCNYGTVLLQLHRPEEARSQFATALKFNTNCARAREALATFPVADGTTLSPGAANIP